MFPEPTELLLIGCSIESIWTLKSKSNTLTPETNSQTYWPKEISHVMNGIIFCVCSTLAISILPIVLKWCRKERKKDSGEKRVTARSKPMMNLVSRCSERTPNVPPSTASESPVKTRHESQFLLSRIPWRLKINISRNSVHFRKSHVCANKLDVQETDFSFTQFYRSWNHFSWCRFTHGRYSRSHSPGFGDWSISFRTEQNRWTQERATGNPSAVVMPNRHNPIPSKHTNVIPTNIDHIPSNTTHSGPSAMSYVFEDNEAEIKMNIKGRSPTLRHVSRTHWVVLDWLFDRIVLDPKIQIRYTDSTHQLADMLTEGNFTRDEWNNLLQ